jgi:hypothetical protein
MVKRRSRDEGSAFIDSDKISDKKNAVEKPFKSC